MTRTPAEDAGVPREQFYAGRPERIASRELDFGVMWRREGSREPGGRVTWIHATGEIYLEHHERIELLGAIATEEAVEAALSGWEHVCGSEGGIGWVRARISMSEDGHRREVAEAARRRREGRSLATAMRSPRRPA